ncbi:FAD-binding oxidoreductase, partial [Alphaproteobacteria bacterium]|nr:FAD-binding oxidoreductase [Alphaproteobacteria bacterium]
MAQPKIIVIGAGICGVSTAIWLQRYGYQVILMDRGEPGMGASFGNAGLIAQWAVVPMTTPALWGNLPSLLFNPKSTFSLKWGYMPRLVPWLAQFLSQATDAKARQTVSHLMPLLSDAVDQHKALSSGTPVAQWVEDSKISYVYRSQADFEQDAYSWALRR